MRLAEGIPPGEEYRVQFQALRTPPHWLDDWTTTHVDIPAFSIIGASCAEGAVAILPQDDMTVRPGKFAEKRDPLIPLCRTEQAKYGLGDIAASLAYRYRGRIMPLRWSSSERSRGSPRGRSRVFA